MHDENVELGVEVARVVAGVTGASSLACFKGHRRQVLQDEPMDGLTRQL